MSDSVRIWYVSGQRLCNFRCTYCVSINDYAKSNAADWPPEDQARFEKIVDWIADRPFRVGVRLATLGEPFASRPFLSKAAQLSTRPNTDFVELVTNGSLLKRRLEQLDREGDISRISLWVTYHPTEIPLQRFIANARFAQERYGCFVVVNGLLFPDNEQQVVDLKRAAEDAGLRFNLDLGYDPLTPHGVHTELQVMVPILREREEDGVARAVRLGVHPELLDLNMAAMRDLRGQLCSAGHNYFYIGIRGDVYRCSRYQALDKDRIGNVLDDGFDLQLSRAPWTACGAGFGCGNKEDYLHLRRRGPVNGPPPPSLGWVDRDPPAAAARTRRGDDPGALAHVVSAEPSGRTEETR
ncbi:radical SAM protein [Actinoallomurus sp. NPDC052308]|uniref:radical SAM protein n=1 Tax=Actinoallomurus sp. NPDC052308 TaxID=3155530 RepID=UPI003438B767